jgi:hypothetical protein
VIGPRATFGRRTCENFKTIDVREWHRDGDLVPGKTFRHSWVHGSEPAGSVSVRVTRESLTMIGWWVDDQGKRDLFEQRIRITWTECRFGGERPWLMCNGLPGARACERRVAKLYQDDFPAFACRRCHNLRYASQYDRPAIHKLRTAQKIRERLRGSLDIFDPFPDRPRYMHRETYLRWRRLGKAAEAVAMQLMAKGLDISARI